MKRQPLALSINRGGDGHVPGCLGKSGDVAVPTSASGRAFFRCSYVMLLLLASAGISLLQAQVFDENILPQRTPKTEKKPPTPAPTPPAPVKEEVNPDDDNVMIEKLSGIVIVKTREEIKEEGVSGITGVQPVNIPILSGEDFKAKVNWYLNRSMSINDIKSLQNDIILYSRAKNHPLVDVILPPQVLTSGVIQLWFLEGKISKITVENKDRKWFTDMFIMSQVRLHPGQSVDMQKLTEDLDWVNRNPFRQVNTVFRAGSDLGQTEMVLQVDDRIPLRAYVGYENSGTEFTGQDRLLAGFNWGNAFGLDHQFNYQYTTDVDFKAIQAHSASYLIPLPWRHNLAIMGAYADATAEFPGVAAVSKGTSYQTSLRYTIPKRIGKNYIQEITGGFDFKSTDNDLEFGGQTALSRTRIHVAQFQLGYSGLLLDRGGQTSFGLEGYYSPGDIDSDNTDIAFDQLRPQSKAQYFYGRLTAERLTRLPAGFSWVLHGFAQYASERLTPSEEIGIGGFGTVRGYGERLVNGDNGWVINNELRTPTFPVLKRIGIIPWDDRLQFLVFFDYGSVFIKDFSTADAGAGRTKETDLSSAGAGLRYTVLQNLSIRFDYGFELINREPGKNGGGHVGVLLSF
ncbi:MAG TPA: ShlB/FhaC/HecB family hemolysin secretion/activation protein [Candidatus Acidoferrum sp.]|nr:ShlB/FhaC/HecB family hemolysin secretion/activation protein [Candidatus Acidoferrum sp.]